MRPVFHEIIHSPIRLQVCSYLDRTDGARFAEVQEKLGITDSHLSKNIRILSEADLVEQSRVPITSRTRTKTVTFLSLTPVGKTAFREHSAWLGAITQPTSNDPEAGSPS
ncbi:transcriptional regulator [Auritidibacter ignavus]|uniref:transcriptional regulator n=1 Tax=Auritidibacter ignavus TaxID=678932 RepID=UPI00109BFC34